LDGSARDATAGSTGPAAAAALAGSALAGGSAVAAAPSASRAEPDPLALPAINDPAPVLAGAWRDEAEALRGLALAWQLALPEGNACEQAQAAGLVCHRAGSGLGVLRQLDRPAVLVLREESAPLPAATTGSSAPAYVVLLGVGPTGATLAAGSQRWRLALPALGRVWRGEFATFWRSPPGWRAGVDPVEDPALQTWLLQRLGEAGGLVPGVPLREQVRNFQVVNGLQADGRAGPLTLMLLGHADEPRLLQDR
jgi:general secretion pathway protein A